MSTCGGIGRARDSISNQRQLPAWTRSAYSRDLRRGVVPQPRAVRSIIASVTSIRSSPVALADFRCTDSDVGGVGDGVEQTAVGGAQEGRDVVGHAASSHGSAPVPGEVVLTSSTVQRPVGVGCGFDVEADLGLPPRVLDAFGDQPAFSSEMAVTSLLIEVRGSRRSLIASTISRTLATSCSTRSFTLLMMSMGPPRFGTSSRRWGPSLRTI